MILQCGGPNCQSQYQDQKYGPGRRVHNLTKASGSTDIYRCTICKTERGKSGTEEKKRK